MTELYWRPFISLPYFNSLSGNKHPKKPSVNKHIFCLHKENPCAHLTPGARPKMESWVFLFFFREDVSLGCPYPSIQLPPPPSPSKSIKILLLAYERRGEGQKDAFLCPSIPSFLFSPLPWWPPPPSNLHKQAARTTERKTFLFSLAKIRFFYPLGPSSSSQQRPRRKRNTKRPRSKSWFSIRQGRKEKEGKSPFPPSTPMSTRGRKICPNCERWGGGGPSDFPHNSEKGKKSGQRFWATLAAAFDGKKERLAVGRSVGRPFPGRPHSLLLLLLFWGEEEETASAYARVTHPPPPPPSALTHCAAFCVRGRAGATATPKSIDAFPSPLSPRASDEQRVRIFLRTPPYAYGTRT